MVRLDIIALVITQRPLCRACLVHRAGGSATSVASGLRRVGRILHLRRARARCHGCGNIDGVVSVETRSA